MRDVREGLIIVAFEDCHPLFQISVSSNLRKNKWYCVWPIKINFVHFLNSTWKDRHPNC